MGHNLFQTNVINLRNPGVLTMILVALDIHKVMAWLRKTIQTVKKTLRKTKLSNNDPYLAILALRTTPRQKC